MLDAPTIWIGSVENPDDLTDSSDFSKASLISFAFNAIVFSSAFVAPEFEFIVAVISIPNPPSKLGEPDKPGCPACILDNVGPSPNGFDNVGPSFAPPKKPPNTPDCAPSAVFSGSAFGSSTLTPDTFNRLFSSNLAISSGEIVLY